MNQILENGKTPNLGPNFGSFGSNVSQTSQNCCPTNVETPKRKKEAANVLLTKCNKFIEFVFAETSGTIKPSIHYLLAK